MKTVTSADGTVIAYEQGGTGPHLLLVHGTTANRKRFASIRPRFEKHFTVTTMDRRGCGDSGDNPEYAIEREFEDIVSVVSVVGAPVVLFGHSYGALCALGAAMRTDRLSGLILYEPYITGGESLYAPGQLERLNSLLAAGDREGVVKTMFAEIVGAPPHEMERLASSPLWPGRVAAAHTTRERLAQKKVIACLPTKSASCRSPSCFSSVATAHPWLAESTPC
jgi:pimeloyl-ACP methyl ester carboxylesterase